MSGGKNFLGCLSAIAGFIGIFLAISMSFTFYLIPLAFIVFLGSMILISSALGPGPPPPGTGGKPPEAGREPENEPPDQTSQP